MLLSAVSVLVVAQSSSEIPEGIMNNPVCVAVLLYVGDGVRRLFDMLPQPSYLRETTLIPIKQESVWTPRTGLNFSKRRKLPGLEDQTIQLVA